MKSESNDHKEKDTSLLLVVIAFPLAAVIIFLVTISGIMIQSGLSGGGSGNKSDSKSGKIAQADAPSSEISAHSDPVFETSMTDPISQIMEAPEQESTSGTDISSSPKDLFPYVNASINGFEEAFGVTFRSNLAMLDQGSVQVQEFEGKIEEITLVGKGPYCVLDIAPGDNTEEAKEKLIARYDAKTLQSGTYDTNETQLYLERNGTTYFVNLFDKNGVIDVLSCHYDFTGNFEPPKDMTGTNMFEYTEVIDDPMIEDFQ